MAPDLAQDALASAQSQASVFRLLTWKATIPLEIRISRDSLPSASGDDGANVGVNDGGLDADDDDVPTYYVSTCVIAYPFGI